MSILTRTLSLSALLLAGCADRPEPTVSIADLLARADELDAPRVVAALRTLGVPHIESRAVPNPYDGASEDSVRTFRADGFEATLYWVASSGQELVQSIVVSSDRFETGLDFGVGATREQVRSSLGPPGREDAGAWSWDLYQDADDPIPTALTVRFAPDGRVVRITWEYYLG